MRSTANAGARYCAPIDRRSFLADSAIGVAVMALASSCGRDITSPDVGEPIGHSIVVAEFPDLTPIGGIAMVSLEGTPLAIVRTGDATFLALSRVCPHNGAVVSQSASGFRCPRHGARFDTDGTWAGGERTGSLRVRNTTYDVASDVLTIG